MKKLLSCTAVVVFAVGCATAEKPKPTPEAAAQTAPKTEQQKIQNLGYFNTAVCDSTPKKITGALTNEAVVAALLYAQPFVIECEVDPKNRGPADETTVVIDTTVTAEGPKHEFSGQNLTDAGKACIQSALEKVVSLPTAEKGAQPAKGHVEIQHHVGTSPSVKMGINEPSDIFGQIRLAQPQWCDCYKSFATKVTPVVEGELHFVKGKPTEVKVNGTDAELTSCLTQKVQSLNLTSTSDELKLPLRMTYTNSRAESASDLPSRPDLAFTQLDLLRGVRSADAALAIGRRATAVAKYDAAVKKYQQTKDYKMLGELKTKCAALTDADKDWVKAMKQVQDIEETTFTFAQKQKATDPSWAQAEELSQKQAEQAKKDVAAAEASLKGDEAACPKTK